MSGRSFLACSGPRQTNWPLVSITISPTLCRSAKPCERDVDELRHADGLLVHVLFDRLAVSEQDTGGPFQEPARPGAAEREADDEIVGDEERPGAEHTTGDRVVVPDQRVLKRVRGEQQHRQIENVDLAELPLAPQPQRDREEHEDEQGAEDLLVDPEMEIEQAAAERSDTCGHPPGFRRRTACSC